jgi:hypothetical protein
LYFADRPGAAQCPDTPEGGLPLEWSPAGRELPVLFTVRPAAGGWRLQGEDLEDTLFANGAEAERQARRLALGVARVGRDAKVNVHDARDVLVGAVSYFGCEALPEPELSRRRPPVR